mmetsp:Transcript_3090/g.1896  ORF Transcript_3090/g.1896 Transcript_3090/m.1896 type:complete len:115 (+) Transcript_3090:103-447(+)|eukprot:CAMPEP_0203639992 /NCGR_PEP_ID=MMETSP0088-20131115/5606_1 /ASSEMBLY_ACC=CAM_ASM_001087 /TAXON_ID=426623 /ORGANISM="Chaetoceros affinis, Strain CCMP159" /LENGTH=114 /DNA_ID=CAMNT_0050495051 /DNA_START=116 /DNA_END=460 /DNA_ORIENTATION=+
MKGLKSFRKNKKIAVPETPAVPEVPEVSVPEVPEVPDVDEMKESAMDKAGDIAGDMAPGNMKWMMFKIWLASKFSCCLGTPEMPMSGLVDVPEVDIPEVDVPEVPKVDVPKIGL